ncbi:MAG: hypothetical protein VYB54_03930 [Pseudomonadota bacterium]|nr:hypothetical protein [Pseudomonadota bacterium]
MMAGKEGKEREQAEKAERLARALRENLKRRRESAPREDAPRRAIKNTESD